MRPNVLIRFYILIFGVTIPAIGNAGTTPDNVELYNMIIELRQENRELKKRLATLERKNDVFTKKEDTAPLVRVHSDAERTEYPTNIMPHFSLTYEHLFLGYRSISDYGYYGSTNYDLESGHRLSAQFENGDGDGLRLEGFMFHGGDEVSNFYTGSSIENIPFNQKDIVRSETIYSGSVGLTKRVSISEDFSVTPFAGIEGAVWETRDYNTYFNNGVFVYGHSDRLGSTIGYEQSPYEEKIYGIGPNIEISTKYDIGFGDIVSKAGYSFLFSEAEGHPHLNLQNTPQRGYINKFEAGLGWEISHQFDNGPAIKAGIGVEWQRWNAIRSLRCEVSSTGHTDSFNTCYSNWSSDTKDIDLFGLSARMAVQF